MHRQTVEEGLQKSGGKSERMGHGQGRHGYVTIVQTERSMKAVHIRSDLRKGKELTATAAGTADGLFHQSGAARDSAGGHPAGAIFFHHLNRATVQETSEQGRDDLWCVTLGEIECAKPWAVLRRQSPCTGLQFPESQGTKRVQESDLIALRLQDSLPAFTKHLTALST
jgi:hypothetical protein